MATVTGSSPAPLFFAFPDGIFHHVCAECNALCCRGSGFAGSLKREMPFLLERYPGLSTMVKGREGDILHFATPAKGCFFLNDTRLCQIELEHGKAKKPGVCTVFPFNYFKRIGRTVAVMPHFGCPLRVQFPARPGKVEGTHAAIKRAIRDTALLEKDYVELHMPDTRLHAAETASSVLAREGQFRDTCAAALGHDRFSDVLLAMAADSRAMRKTVSRAMKLMDWTSKSRNDDAFDNLLFAMAPSLRMEALHLPAENITTALLLAESGASHAFSISEAEPSPQSLYDVIQNLSFSIRLLSYGNDVPPIRAGMNDAPFGPSKLSFIYRVAVERISKDGTLKGLEKTFKSDVSPSDRAAIVRQIGFQIESLPA